MSRLFGAYFSRFGPCLDTSSAKATYCSPLHGALWRWGEACRLESALGNMHPPPSKHPLIPHFLPVGLLRLYAAVVYTVNQ